MAPQAAPDAPYYLVPNMRALDPSAREIDINAHTWIQATVIEDEDLTFGGKSLSAWYEEDRRRISGDLHEEERRGRPKMRAHYSGKHHSHRHHHQTSSKQSSGSDKKN